MESTSLQASIVSFHQDPMALTRLFRIHNTVCLVDACGARTILFSREKCPAAPVGFRSAGDARAQQAEICFFALERPDP
jgi:hypothetical protein